MIIEEANIIVYKDCIYFLLEIENKPNYYSSDKFVFLFKSRGQRKSMEKEIIEKIKSMHYRCGLYKDIRVEYQTAIGYDDSALTVYKHSIVLDLRK